MELVLYERQRAEGPLILNATKNHDNCYFCNFDIFTKRMPKERVGFNAAPHPSHRVDIKRLLHHRMCIFFHGKLE
jgi:hypothetical protein